MIVVGIDTSTPQTSVAIGTENEILAKASVAGAARQESVTPLLSELLARSDLTLSQIGGVAVGIGPGLFTGLRVGVETAKTLAQVANVPDRGHHEPRCPGVCDPLLATADRGGHRRPTREVFSAIYRAVPGGIVREREYEVHAPDRLAAELQAMPGEVLAVGNGAMLYRHVLEEIGSRIEFASSIAAHPEAAALVELAVPRFLREEHDRLFDVVPAVPEEVRC